MTRRELHKIKTENATCMKYFQRRMAWHAEDDNRREKKMYGRIYGKAFRSIAKARNYASSTARDLPF